MSTPSLDRLPPNDVAAEMAVLGCILIDAAVSVPSCLERIGSNREIFYDLKHQELYRVMTEMYDAQEPIDLVTLSSWLEFQGLLESSGGTAFLAKLLEATPSSANLPYYLGILEEKLKYRKLIQLGTQLVSGSYDGNGTANELISDAADGIQGMVEDAVPKQAESALHDLIPGALHQIEQWSASQGAVSGLSTGFADLDKMTTGLHPGELIVIAGRPSFGKTSIAMNVAEHVAVDLGLPVGVFSLEMTKESLTVRMLCSRSRVNLRQLREGYLAERDLPKLSAAAGKLSQAQVFINDQSGLSILELRTRARRMAQQHGIRLLVVDYLQLMHAERHKNDSRDREIGMISGGLKGLAKELGIPVIAVSQLNRCMDREKERRPRLSDLRESGNIEQDADVIGILWKDSRSEDENPQEAVAVNLEILKQRNGPTGTVPLTFLRGYTRFESTAKVTAEDVQEAQEHYEVQPPPPDLDEPPPEPDLC